MKTLNERLPTLFGVSTLGLLGIGNLLFLVYAAVNDATISPTAVDALVLYTALFVLLNGLNVASRSLDSFDAANDVATTDPVSVTKARDAEGTVEVTGPARPLNGTLRSKYTDTPCVAYSYAEETGKHPDAGGGSRTVDEGSAAVPFVVKDATGELAVDADAADLSLASERTNGFFSRSEKTESRLDVGETVHVHGRLCEDDDGPADVYVGELDDGDLHVSDASAEATVTRHLYAGARSVVGGAVFVAVATGIVSLFL
jgi:hypothetical protein